MDNGFIPLYRRIFEHPLWCEDRPYSRFEAWIDLLQSARFEDTTTKKIINGKVICWNRGQLPISISYLEKRWNWTPKRVRVFLKMLENEGMITKGIAKGNPTTILTVCNYEYYNGSGHSQRQSKGKGGARRGQQVVEQGEQRKEIYPPYPPDGGTGGGVETGRSPRISSESFTELPGRAAETGPPPLSWRDDFPAYQTEARMAMERLKTDQEFIAEQQRFYPGIDIGLSLEKAYCNFWGITEGWEHKKKQKSRTINWSSTYKNALSLKSNQVALSVSPNYPPRKPIRIE